MDIEQLRAEVNNPNYNLIHPDTAPLLELVDKEQYEVYELRLRHVGIKTENDLLQQRVRELEADIKQCRDNYDGNHGG